VPVRGGRRSYSLKAPVKCLGSRGVQKPATKAGYVLILRVEPPSDCYGVPREPRGDRSTLDGVLRSSRIICSFPTHVTLLLPFCEGRIVLFAFNACLCSKSLCTIPAHEIEEAKHEPIKDSDRTHFLAGSDVCVGVFRARTAETDFRTGNPRCRSKRPARRGRRAIAWRPNF
jgi:hypothetical protein